MADRALRFDLLGRDKNLGRTLGQAEGKFKRFGSTAVKMGAVIGGAFAGLAIGGFLKDAVDEAREAQKVGRQTAAVLKATGGAAKVSAKDVDRLATALSNKAGVDDELIASGANLLLTFKGVRNEAGKGNRIFDQASSAILDMTAAMNNGEVSASGLKTSTIQVGKALNDPIKGMAALTRVGVTFTQKQKDQIKTLVEAGDKMGAQKIILGELKSEFGGAAAAAADPWQRFSVLMGNIKERVGTALLPALTGVFDFLTTTLIPGIERYVSRIGGFVGRVGEAIGPAIGRLTGDIQAKFDQFKPKLTSFRTNLVTGVRKLAQPVLDALGKALKTGDYGPLGKAVGDAVGKTLGATGDLAGTVANWVKQQFDKVDWVNVGKVVGGQAFGFIVGFVTGFGTDIIKVAKAHPVDLALFVANVLAVGKIGGFIAKAFSKVPFLRAFAPLFEGLNKLTNPVNNAIGKLVGFIGRAFREGLARVFPSLGKSLRGGLGRTVGDALAWLALRAEAFGKAGAKLIRNLAIGIGQEVGQVVKDIGRVIAAITKPFIGSAGWLVKRGGQVVTGLIRGVEIVGRGVGRVALRIIEALTRPFRPAVGWLVQRGREAILGLGRGIVGKLGDVTAWMGRVKDRAIAPFRNAVGWLQQAGRNVLHGLWEGLVSKWQAVKDWFLKIPNWIKEHKGPLSLDRRLLFPAGAAIMGGFAKGLKSGAKDAMGFVTGIVGDIWGLLGGLGGAPGMTAGAGGPVVSLARNMAAAMGWTGPQWQALYNLVQGESGWNPNAQNPTSTAYGLFQFLNSTWGSVGASKTSDPAAQIVAGFRYIQQRYGSPMAAYGAWLSRSPHWYGEGGIFSKPSIIGVGERGPEAVVPLDQLGGGMVRLHPDSVRALGRVVIDGIVAAGPAINIDSRRVEQVLAGAGVSNARRR